MTAITMRLVALGTLLAATASFAAPAPRPLDIRSPVQDKTFYVLSLVERTPGTADALRKERALTTILERKRAALKSVGSTCNSPTCIDTAMRWTDAEIGVGAEALKRALSTATESGKQLDHALRDSGAYVREESRPGSELLAQAWTDAAQGMNQAIDVYGEGLNTARYATMDPPAFDVKSEYYGMLVQTAAMSVAEEAADLPLFFQPTLRYALQLLDINKRDEAGRYEPLDKGENAAALEQIGHIDWAKFPYTLIVVPGQGPDTLSWPLDPVGKLRVELAARRWRQGLAPLILVSGGHAHPNHTPYSEAVEMKRALMTTFGVPENAILIDPHARHTTTNTRNAARYIYRYGIPFERPALITSDRFQSGGIESELNAQRCVTELGYVPHRIIKRLSPFDLVWRPNIESLQTDAAGDLLDP